MLEGIGYGPRVAAAYAPWATADDAVPARVLDTRPGLVTALTEEGPRQASLGAGLLSAVAADAGAGPRAGDWVVLRAWPDRRWTVEAVLPRRTSVPGQGDPCCANVDVLVVLGGPWSRVPAVRGVERVGTDGRDVTGLRQRLAAGQTLAVAGGDRRSRAALVRRLAGTPLLAGPDDGPRLLLVPGGGALLVLACPPGAGLGDPGPGHVPAGP